ncbi:hypothetical protein BDZ91DRAFT_331198 [Kalaharituber pfeilii]|nr:hypothetical protein BDZ91DRAFT_331198 [Kalaharituber pfeilii]
MPPHPGNIKGIPGGVDRYSDRKQLRSVINTAEFRRNDGIDSPRNTKIRNVNVADARATERDGALLKRQPTVYEATGKLHGSGLPGPTKHRDDFSESPVVDDGPFTKVKNVRPAQGYKEDIDSSPPDIGGLHRKIVLFVDKFYDKVENAEVEFEDVLCRIDGGSQAVRDSLTAAAENSYGAGGTLLHACMVGSHLNMAAVDLRFRKRYQLLKYLTDNHPELYIMRDEELQRVLELAVKKGSAARLKGLNKFVQFFINKFPEQSAAQVNVDEPDPTEENEDLGFDGAMRIKIFQELLEQIKHLVEKYPDIITHWNSNHESPYLHRINTMREYIKENGGDPLTQMQELDVITHYLKDLCMHRPIEEAMTLLYGPRRGPGKSYISTHPENKSSSLYRLPAPSSFRD